MFSFLQLVHFGWWRLAWRYFFLIFDIKPVGKYSLRRGNAGAQARARNAAWHVQASADTVSIRRLVARTLVAVAVALTLREKKTQKRHVHDAHLTVGALAFETKSCNISKNAPARRPSRTRSSRRSPSRVSGTKCCSTWFVATERDRRRTRATSLPRRSLCGTRGSSVTASEVRRFCSAHAHSLAFDCWNVRSEVTCARCFFSFSQLCLLGCTVQRNRKATSKSSPTSNPSLASLPRTLTWSSPKRAAMRCLAWSSGDFVSRSISWTKRSWVNYVSDRKSCSIIFPLSLTLCNYYLPCLHLNIKTPPLLCLLSPTSNTVSRQRDARVEFRSDAQRNERDVLFSGKNFQNVFERN